MFSVRRRYAVALISLSAAAGVTAYRAYAGDAQAIPAQQAPAAVVDVAVVHDHTITDWHAYSGRLEAVGRVEIRPQVSGTITAVHFKDGSLVSQGDELFTIDPRPYQAAVDRAKAQLEGARARVVYAASELRRAQRLLAANAVAKRDFEQKRNEARVASADQSAAVAALEAAQLDLEHTRIVAPIAGRVSRAEVTLGNVVQAGANAPVLTSLVSVDKVYAAFDLDEQSYLRLMNRQGNRQGDAMQVALGLGNESGYPRVGRLASIDNSMDVASGTIRVRAIFDNKDQALLPGLYARIRVSDGAPRQAVLIDEKAIGTDQDKRFVLVLNDEDKTAYRQVTLGAMQKGGRVIESGLAPGERIVVNGLQRVRPGDPVQPRLAQADGPAHLAAGPASGMQPSNAKAVSTSDTATSTS